MKNWGSRNKKVDRIGTGLFKAVTLGNDEIEEIASRPHLFDGLMARIEAETAVSREANRPGRTIAEIFRRPSFMVPAATVMLLTVILGTMRYVDRRYRADVVAFAPPPVTFTDSTQNIEPPAFVARREQPKSVAYAIKASVERTAAPLTRRQQSHPIEQPEQLEFYPLAGMETISEDAEDTRIVRVDLPRASLYSLGVNVPIEYGTTMIKTDLLVGADGVPHAIRPVK